MQIKLTIFKLTFIFIFKLLFILLLKNITFFIFI
nr:MAG TPA: hypothetical protein [Caudoviricetes sp.]